MEKSAGLFRMKDTDPTYTMGWDEVGREKNKPSERGAMKWRAGKAMCMAVTTTCVSCLEDYFIYLFIYLLNFNYTDLNIIYTLEDKLTIKISKKKNVKITRSE